MLAYNVQTLDQITADGNSSVTDAGSYYEHTFYVRLSSGSASIVIQGSADGTNYQDVSTAITASDVIYISGAHPYLRVNVSSSSSPVIDVDVVQFGSNPLAGR